MCPMSCQACLTAHSWDARASDILTAFLFNDNVIQLTVCVWHKGTHEEQSVVKEQTISRTFCREGVFLRLKRFESKARHEPANGSLVPLFLAFSRCGFDMKTECRMMQTAAFNKHHMPCICSQLRQNNLSKLVEPFSSLALSQWSIKYSGTQLEVIFEISK